MGQNHIAKSGRSAGKWVSCSAQVQCRNGGSHLDTAALKEISEKTYTPVKELTLEDVKNYIEQAPPEFRQTIDNAAAQAKKDEQDRETLRNIEGAGFLMETPEALEKLVQQKRTAEKLLPGSAPLQVVLHGPNTAFPNTIGYYKRDGRLETHVGFVPDPDANDGSARAVRTEREYFQGHTSLQIERFDTMGELHDLGDRPAVFTKANGVKESSHYQHGQLHRDGDQPAIHAVSDDHKLIHKEYYQHGQLHRDGDQPAVHSKDIKAREETIIYAKHGKLTRSDLSQPVRTISTSGEKTYEFADEEGNIIRTM